MDILCLTRYDQPEESHLVVEVVEVLGHEDVDVPHDLQHVETLLQGLRRQMRLSQRQPELVLRQVTHLAVGPPVVQRHRGQVVEGRVQVVLHIRCNTLTQVRDSAHPWQLKPQLMLIGNVNLDTCIANIFFIRTYSRTIDRWRKH